MYQAKSAGRNRLEVFAAATDGAESSAEDLSLKHLENVTRVATERLVGMITLKSRRLVDAANEKANYCPKTGLYNDAYLKSRLSSEMQLARLHSRPLSLVLIDIDKFRDINANFGWPSGDRVLRAFADVSRATVRASDWVARYAGDEFVIVMPDTVLEQATQVAERVRQAFEASSVDSVDGRRVPATLSASVAQLPGGVTTVEVFLHLASEALKGKPAGRNRVEQFRGDGTGAAARAQPGSGPAVASIDPGPSAPEAGAQREARAPTDGPFNLARFVDAQADEYERFIGGLRRGRKLGHCMWFMFPQIVGLGYSHESRRYGITGLDEAVAYLAHPLLGTRLLECAAALEMLDATLSVDDIFRHPDDLKLRSCLTLFALVSEPGSVFERLIGRYFAGVRDHITEARLQRRSGIEVAGVAESTLRA